VSVAKYSVSQTWLTSRVLRFSGTMKNEYKNRLQID